jgi:hypothetical protein
LTIFHISFSIIINSGNAVVGRYIRLGHNSNLFSTQSYNLKLILEI